MYDISKSSHLCVLMDAECGGNQGLRVLMGGGGLQPKNNLENRLDNKQHEQETYMVTKLRYWLGSMTQTEHIKCYSVVYADNKSFRGSFCLVDLLYVNSAIYLNSKLVYFSIVSSNIHSFPSQTDLSGKRTCIASRMNSCCPCRTQRVETLATDNKFQEI